MKKRTKILILQKYLEDDQEKYFELLKIWKIKNEKTYFEKY